MNYRETLLNKRNAQGDREELVERMALALPADGRKEVYLGLHLFRSSVVDKTAFSVMEPVFCVIAQGSKEITLGDEAFRYDAGHYLISTVDLPTVGRVIEASAERPYFGLRLNLDPALVTSVLVESGIGTKKGEAGAQAMNVQAIDANLFDATLRLVRLLDQPNDHKILAPLIIKEIIYRLILGGQGGRLSHLVASEDHSRRISRAIKQLRENIEQPLKIERLARELGMSVSGFHHHFKSVTTMSPAKRVDLIENVLRSYNPGGRIYAAISLLRMEKKRHRLTAATKVTIDKIMNSDASVTTCWGDTGVTGLKAKDVIPEYVKSKDWMLLRTPN